MQMIMELRATIMADNGGDVGGSPVRIVMVPPVYASLSHRQQANTVRQFVRLSETNW